MGLRATMERSDVSWLNQFNSVESNKLDDQIQNCLFLCFFGITAKSYNDFSFNTHSLTPTHTNACFHLFFSFRLSVRRSMQLEQALVACLMVIKSYNNRKKHGTHHRIAFNWDMFGRRAKSHTDELKQVKLSLSLNGSLINGQQWHDLCPTYTQIDEHFHQQNDIRLKPMNHAIESNAIRFESVCSNRNIYNI